MDSVTLLNDLKLLKKFIAHVERHAYGKTVARGTQYFNEHRISHIRKENSTWNAVARGTYLYNMSINLERLSSTCNCPALSPCKHVYAFALSLQRQLLRTSDQMGLPREQEQAEKNIAPRQKSETQNNSASAKNSRNEFITDDIRKLALEIAKYKSTHDSQDEAGYKRSHKQNWHIEKNNFSEDEKISRQDVISLVQGYEAQATEEEEVPDEIFYRLNYKTNSFEARIKNRLGEQKLTDTSAPIYYLYDNEINYSFINNMYGQNSLLYLHKELDALPSPEPSLYVDNKQVKLAGTLELELIVENVDYKNLEKYFPYLQANNLYMQYEAEAQYAAALHEIHYHLQAQIRLTAKLQNRGWQRKGNLLAINKDGTKIMLPHSDELSIEAQIAVQGTPLVLSMRDLLQFYPLLKKKKSRGLELFPPIFTHGPLPVIKVEGQIDTQKNELRALQLQLSFAYTDTKITSKNKYQLLENAAFCLPLDFRQRQDTLRGDINAQGQAVLRNTEKEKKLNLKYNMLRFKSDGSLRLGANKIFSFFQDILPQLQKNGVEVFIPAELESLRVKQRSFFIDVKSSGMDWFEAEISADGFSKEDISVVMQAFYNHQETARLKDGRWIRMDDLQLKKIFAALAALGVRAHKDGLSQKINLGQAVALLQDDVIKKEKLSAQTHQRLFQWAGKKDFAAVPSLALPKDFLQKLRLYQVDGVRFFLQRHNAQIGGILADDMGLGKTIQGIAFLASLYNTKKTQQNYLIVAPPAALSVWQQEITRFYPELPHQVWHGAQRKNQTLIDDGVIITSYATLQRDIHMLNENKKFAVVLVDEAQYLKNHQSVSGKAVRDLHAESIFCLTGTPVENHPVEIWSLMDIILPGLLGTLKNFRASFSGGYEREQIENLRKRIAPFLLRRTRAEVLKDLPSRSEQNIFSPMTASQSAKYESVRVQAVGILSAAGKNYLMMILPYLMKLRRIACHPDLGNQDLDPAQSGKILQFLDMADELEESSRGILVFSQFTDMLDLFEKVLQTRNQRYLRLDGSTSVKNRETMVTQFQTQNNILYFLISLRAGGTALTLHRADTILHLDPWWNPAVEEQATARAHRMGQKNPVFVYKFFTEKSVEEKVLTLQEKKRQLFDDLLNQGSQTSNKFSREDILSILQEE